MKKVFVKTIQDTFVEVGVISTMFTPDSTMRICKIKNTNFILGFDRCRFFLSEKDIENNKGCIFNYCNYFTDGDYLKTLNKRCNVKMEAVYYQNAFRVELYYWNGNSVESYMADYLPIKYIEHYIGQDLGFYLERGICRKDNLVGDAFIDAFNNRERSFIAGGKKYYLSAEECKADNKPIIIKMQEEKEPEVIMRVTWRSEVFIKGKNKDDVMSKFENLDLFSSDVVNNGGSFVETISVEKT